MLIQQDLCLQTVDKTCSTLKKATNTLQSLRLTAIHHLAKMQYSYKMYKHTTKQYHIFYNHKQVRNCWMVVVLAIVLTYSTRYTLLDYLVAYIRFCVYTPHIGNKSIHERFQLWSTIPQTSQILHMQYHGLNLVVTSLSVLYILQRLALFILCIV